MAKHGKHARVQEADAELVDGASVQAAPEYDALENNAPEATKGISAHQKKSKRMPHSAHRRERGARGAYRALG